MPHVRVPDGPQDKGPGYQGSHRPVGIVDPVDWRASITGFLPSLRAFAFTLSRNSADADDLVQETLTKAWAHRARFEPGSNLRFSPSCATAGTRAPPSDAVKWRTRRGATRPV